MSSKRSRLKGALRRVFKVRSRGDKVNTKHVALIDSPAAATADSKTESASTAIPSSRGIPNLDLLIQRKNGFIDLDEVTCFSDKTGVSIKTEAPAPVRVEYVRQESTHESVCNNQQTVDPLKDSETSQYTSSLPKTPFTRSCSVPYYVKNKTSSDIRRASDELPTVHSDEEVVRNSPTGVTDFFSLLGRGSPPLMPPNQHRSRSRSDSGETATSRTSKCIVSRHNHDAQKANEAFLALKKELEKNEFTKAAQVLKQAQSQEGSIVTASPSQESSGKSKQKLPNQQYGDTYEIIPASPSVESKSASVHNEVLDNILGITPVVSQSESLESQVSDGSSYSSFDTLDSIGEITIDSTTQRLIEMHKSYCDNAKVNENHPARMKKSNLRVSSAYPIEMTKSDSSIRTEANSRRLTWYDEGENVNKPFTLRTDESFDSMSIGSSGQSFEGVHKGLKMMDRFLIPFTRQGLEKILGSMNCGANHEDELSMQSMQG